MKAGFLQAYVQRNGMGRVKDRLATAALVLGVATAAAGLTYCAIKSQPQADTYQPQDHSTPVPVRILENQQMMGIPM